MLKSNTLVTTKGMRLFYKLSSIVIFFRLESNWTLSRSRLTRRVWILGFMGPKEPLKLLFFFMVLPGSPLLMLLLCCWLKMFSSGMMNHSLTHVIRSLPKMWFRDRMTSCSAHACVCVWGALAAFVSLSCAHKQGCVSKY